MQTKYYGSIIVSKTMGVGSTPTVCDFMKGITMEEQLIIFVLFFFITNAIIMLLAMFFTIALDIIPIWILNIKDFIDEIKR